MGKTLFNLASLVLFAALILSGCSTFSAQELERPPLKVEYTIWEGDYTLLIAQEKGFFAKHGVEVEPVFYKTFSDAIPAMGSSRIDAGLFAIGDMITVSRATDVKAVATYDSGTTPTFVSTQEVKTVADLKGKKIGLLVGTYSELFARQMLARAGLSVQDVQLVNVNPEEVPQRLSEDIDVGYVWSPYDQLSVDAGHKVLYSGDGASSLSPDVIVFRADVVRERPEDVRAFVAAWFEALEYRLANPDECNQIAARLTNQAVEDVLPGGENKLYTMADNLQLFDINNPAGNSIYNIAKINLDYMISRGSITMPPDLNQVLDPSFLQ